MDTNGNYIITEWEYTDIEKVIDDKDKYLNHVIYFRNNLDEIHIK